MSPEFRSSVQTTRKITRKFSFFSALFLLGMTLLTFFTVWSGDLTLEIEVGDDTILNPYFCHRIVLFAAAAFAFGYRICAWFANGVPMEKLARH